MISGLVNALKSIDDMVYNNSLTIDILNYARNFIQKLAKIKHKLNQLYSRLMKLDSDVSTIYKYIDAVSNISVTPTSIDPIDLKTILINYYLVI